MKLYATITSERNSRPAKKGGDEYLEMRLYNGNIAIFDLIFRPDDFKRGWLEIMSYCNGEKQVIEYDIKAKT